MERRIERSLLDLQDVIRAVLDPPRDPIAMARRPREGFEDHEVEGALQEIDGGIHALSAERWRRAKRNYPRTPRYIHRSPRVIKTSAFQRLPFVARRAPSVLSAGSL